jgi:sortase A
MPHRAAMRKRSKVRRRMGWVEAAAWTLGFLMLGSYVAGRWYFSHSGDTAVQLFREARRDADQLASTQRSEPAPQEARTNLARDAGASVRASRAAATSTSPTPSTDSLAGLGFASPDMTLWSPGRIAKYSSVRTEIPEAVLRIDALQLEVPIYAGTDEWNLNRGAGRLEGSAPFDVVGNTVLAAHRDGYFRSLQKLNRGDGLQVQTLHGTFRYVVTDIKIVRPTAIEVLAPTSYRTLTLVTCYPFYFIGPAPQRFIVRAELEEAPLQS